MQHVLYVKQGGSIDIESSIILAKRFLTSYEEKGSDLIANPALKKVDLKKWSAITGATLLIIVGCIVVFFKLKNRPPSPKPVKQPKPIKKKQKTAPQKHLPQNEDIDYQGREAIVHYFVST